MAFAFGLRLAAHGVFKVLWDDHVPDLYRLHGHSPGGCTFVDDLLQIGIHPGTADQDICQAHLANDLTQSRLGCPGYCSAIIGHFQGGFLGVPYQPE